MAGVGGAGEPAVLEPVKCKRRTSGPDCLTPAQAGGVSGPPAVHFTGTWPLGVWHRPYAPPTPGL